MHETIGDYVCLTNFLLQYYNITILQRTKAPWIGQSAKKHVGQDDSLLKKRSRWHFTAVTI